MIEHAWNTPCHTLLNYYLMIITIITCHRCTSEPEELVSHRVPQYLGVISSPLMVVGGSRSCPALGRPWRVGKSMNFSQME